MRSELLAIVDTKYKLDRFWNACMITPETFEKNEGKVTYYTGLPSYTTLMAAFSLVKPWCENTKFQKLFFSLETLFESSSRRLGLQIKRVQGHNIKYFLAGHQCHSWENERFHLVAWEKWVSSTLSWESCSERVTPQGSLSFFSKLGEQRSCACWVGIWVSWKCRGDVCWIKNTSTYEREKVTVSLWWWSQENCCLYPGIELLDL